MEKNEELFRAIAEKFLAKNKNVVLKKMFGKYGVAVNGNVFLCLFNGDFVFKMNGDAHANALKISGAALWDPSGMKRPMKEWVQVPEKNKKEFEKLAEEALKYVSTLPKK